MAVVVTVMLLAAAVAATAAWFQPLHARRHRALVLVALLGAGLVGAAQLLTADPTEWHGLLGTATLLAGVLAVAGGGPLAATALWLVDRRGARRSRAPAGTAEPDHREDSMAEAGEVLRGGAWIGALERAAIFATLAAGWPEGVAVALAVKGVGRYAELKLPGTAERFIIGTFVSVLWAALCALLLLL